MKTLPTATARHSILRLSRRPLVALTLFAIVGSLPSSAFAASGAQGVKEAPAEKLRVHQSLAATASRRGVGLHFKGDRLHFWSCEKPCRSGSSQLSFEIPEAARKLKRTVKSLKLRGDGRVFWVRYGGEEFYYSFLVAGGETAEGEKSPKAPLLVLKGWAGSKSQSQTSIVLKNSAKGDRLFLIGKAEKALCGRETPSTTRLFDAEKARFRSVHLSPIVKKEREAALKLEAKAVSSTSGELLLRLKAASESSAQAPVDADLTKPWSAGYEFVELHPPAGVSLNRLAFSFGKKLETAAHFWVATETALYRVELPPSEQRVYLLDLPEEEELACVTLVQARKAAPFSEVMGRVQVDKKPSLRELVQQLSDSDPGHAPAALSVSGTAGASALAKFYPRLSRLGRGRASEIALEMPVKLAVVVQVAALEYGGDSERQDAMVALKAGGEIASEAIVQRLPQASDAGQVHLGRALAELSPVLAVRALAPKLGEGTSAQRLELRATISRLAESKAGELALRQLIKEQGAGKGFKRSVQVELVRALKPYLKTWGPSSTALVTLLAETANFEEAYRLMPLVFLLAKETPTLKEVFGKWMSGAQPQGASEMQKAALTVLALDLLTEQDPRNKPLRYAGLVRTQTKATNVRVRRSAFFALAQKPDVKAASAIEEALEDDPWPQVRAAAASAAGGFSIQSEAGQDLANSLSSRLKRDPEASARRAMARALGRLGGKDALKALRRSLKKDDAYEVRAESALSLGKLCDNESLEELTELARALAAGQVGDGPILLGLAAVTALARLNPPDLKQRLAPLLTEKASGVLRNQVRRRLETVESGGPGARCSVSSS